MLFFYKKPANLRVLIPERTATPAVPSPTPRHASVDLQDDREFQFLDGPPIPTFRASSVPFSVYEDEVQFKRPATPPPLRPVVTRPPLDDVTKRLDVALVKFRSTLKELNISLDPIVAGSVVVTKSPAPDVTKDANALFFNDYFHEGKSLTSSGYISGAGSAFVVIPPFPAGYTVPQNIFAYYQLSDKQPPPAAVLRGATNPADIFAAVGSRGTREKGPGDAAGASRSLGAIGRGPGLAPGGTGRPGARDRKRKAGGGPIGNGGASTAAPVVKRRRAVTPRERSPMRQFTGVWGQVPRLMKRGRRRKGRRNFARSPRDSDGAAAGGRMN